MPDSKNERKNVKLGVKKERKKEIMKFLIIFTKFAFAGNYVKSQQFLLDNGVKISQAQYYKIINRTEQEAFTELSKLGQNYLTIVADMGAKLRTYEHQIIQELSKERPNQTKINGYVSLVKLQPLLSAYDKQVKRLIERKDNKIVNPEIRN